MDFCNVLLCVDLQHTITAIGENTYLYGTLVRTYNPVFLDASTLVKVILGQPVMSLCRRGENFNNEIRRAFAADVIEFIGITDHGEVRLHQRIDVLWPIAGSLKEAHGEGRGVNSALLPIQIVVELCKERAANLLVCPGGRGHHNWGTF